jgi:glucose/arabinose dehydrogenase
MNVWIRMGAVMCAAALAAGGCASANGGASPAAPRNQVVLFDGRGLDGWEQVGPGRFTILPDGSMVSEGGMGLFYYTRQTFRDFVLELDFLAESEGANSGIFVRFPERPTDPWDAVRGGYEIQIDNLQDALHMTGSVYSFGAASRMAARPAGEWNSYRIEVAGQRYRIYLNGEKVTEFFGNRGREGYIGLQNHDNDSRVRFRNLRVTPLRTPDAPESLADFLAVRERRDPIRVLMVTATQGFRHTDGINASRETMEQISRTTEFRVDMTEDLADLNPQKLANYDLLFFANSTLRVTAPETSGTAGAGTYAIELNTPQGVMRGQLALREENGRPAGTITVDGSPAMPLQAVTVSGENATFAFDAGEYGRIQAAVRMQGDAVQGTLEVMGSNIPLTGTRATGAAAGGFTPVSEAQQRAIMDFVRSGKGVAVAHAGLDAMYGWDEYREMVGGGLFQSHPWTQPVRISVEEPTNPAVSHLESSFWIRDEIYVLDQNPRWNSRVLMSLDMRSVGVTPGSADATRDDYPISWIREHNGGRVFVTKLGHFADVWRNPAFVQHVLQGMRMAAGRVPTDFGGARAKQTLMRDVWATNLAIDPRENVWVVELTGKVHRWDPATGETTLMGEIPTTDPAQIEHGLYDVEVDPDFYNGQPYIYAYYAERETFINTLSRFEVRGGRIDLGTERVLLRVPTEPACCHQAGDLEWGPDGMLFLSTGDTGQSGVRPTQGISEARLEQFVERNELSGHHLSRLADSERTAQNLQDLRGKILRINKDGSIPRSNPFYGQPGVRWEIYATGLRNPYRFTYDRPTNRLYIGVVGPDAQYDYDEYVVSTRGGENFGWPRSMGRLFYNEWTPQQIPGWVPSMWEYTYATGARSAHFGPVYRHSGENAFPGMDGRIFLFDWSRRWIKTADVVNGVFVSDQAGAVRTDDRTFRRPTLRLENIRTFDVLEGTSPIGIVAGRDGCLYVAEFDGFWRPGPRSNLSRYCWNGRGAGAATGAAPAASGVQGR